jgi:hypothetical protein
MGRSDRQVSTRNLPITGISTTLTIIFVVLKLTGTITWSWWWVLAPSIISFGLALLAIGAITVLYVLDEKKAA